MCSRNNEYETSSSSENNDDDYDGNVEKPRLIYNNDSDDNDEEQKEMKNEDNINLVVHVVLDELENSNNFPNSHEKNENNNAIQHARELDNYIQFTRAKRNNFLSQNGDFSEKLQKLMKSICKADTRDSTIPCFTDTEYMLMKSFYKRKATAHDINDLMVEDVIFLNIIRKLSKY